MQPAGASETNPATPQSQDDGGAVASTSLAPSHLPFLHLPAWLPAVSSPSSPLQELGEEELLLWYCAACEKHFKSEPAFANHERSKKHLQQASCRRQGGRQCQMAGAGGGQCNQLLQPAVS